MHRRVTAGLTETELQNLIAAGQDALGIAPPYARLVQLDRQLRAVLDVLVPRVEACTAVLPRHDDQRDIQQRALDQAGMTLKGGLGDGLCSAALQVHTLAQHCQLLHSIAEGAAHDEHRVDRRGLDDQPGAGRRRFPPDVHV